MAPVATAVYLTVVLALVVGRYRWAWVLLVLFNGAAIVGWAFDAHRLAPMRAVWYFLTLGTLLLLLSAPMRGRLRQPVSLPRRVHAGPTP
jgi:predicted membrane channel-forming protein YqfA (hemolysin III family)